MCATCVAQGIGYVGTALVGLQVMGARAKARRNRPTGVGDTAGGSGSPPATDAPSPSPPGTPAAV
jgi:hypothetical protein